jgi:hypothetical protein
MLIEFKVSNYRSIGEEQIISLVPASNQKDHLQNIIAKSKHQALNAVVLYGPNAGGKSNILKSMSLLSLLVHVSARLPSTARLPFDPFLLREGWGDKPTTFEISFIANEHRYRYGLEFNAWEVQKEWLFRKSTGREVNLFAREGEIIEVSSGYNGSKKIIDLAIEATRKNALFLSMSDIFNIEEAKVILLWFKHLNMLDGLNTEEDIRTISLLGSKEYSEKINKYLNNLGLGIHDIRLSKQDFSESDLPTKIPENLRTLLVDRLKDSQSYRVDSFHRVYDPSGMPTAKLHGWDFNERESAGTQQAFNLSGPILWALANGGILIIDEIEAAMHPIMTLNTIDLFLNKESNPNHAQLIFATHDTNLLSYSKLRRDQICFVEKNQWESTELYSLSDFVYFGEKNGMFKSEKERPDTDKEKRYLEGRYGSIPVLGDFQRFIRNIQWQKEEVV